MFIIALKSVCHSLSQLDPSVILIVVFSSLPRPFPVSSTMSFNAENFLNSSACASFISQPERRTRSSPSLASHDETSATPTPMPPAKRRKLVPMLPKLTSLRNNLTISRTAVDLASEFQLSAREQAALEEMEKVSQHPAGVNPNIYVSACSVSTLSDGRQ